MVYRFSVKGDFSISKFPRYRVITSYNSRILLFLIVLPVLFIALALLFFNLGYILRSVTGLHLGESMLTLITPCLIIIAVATMPYCIYLVGSERAYTKKNFEREVKMKKITDERDLVASLSILGRTFYRYSASLEMENKEMIIKDKVTGLINGNLDPKGVGRRLSNDVVRFKLNVDQITAMWVAKDLIIMRFCWGGNYKSAWDVIIDRSNFIEGKDTDFINYVQKNIIYQPIVYNISKFEKHRGYFRLGNKSTNYKENYLFSLTQHEVKVFYVHWGPFKKRKKQEKDEKQLSEEEAK